MQLADDLCLGTKGCVVRIRKRDGKEVWRTKLKGRDLVVVAVEPDGIFAYTRGRLWAPEPDKGGGPVDERTARSRLRPRMIASANQIPVTVAAIQAAAQASAQMSPAAGAAAS